MGRSNQGMGRRDARNCVGHAIETEVDAVGQDRREQGRLVIRRPAVALMREAVGKSCPAVDVARDLKAAGLEVEWVLDAVGIVTRRAPAKGVSPV
jgi:hypothetical protein